MAPLSQLSGHINSTCGAENATSAPQARPHAYYALSYCALILAIVFGNGLVCVAVLRERALKTTTNYLVVSLAVADLLVATLVMPWVVYLEVTGGVWNFSRICCDVFVTLDVMMCTASILNLCAISIDRSFSCSRDDPNRLLFQKALVNFYKSYNSVPREPSLEVLSLKRCFDIFNLPFLTWPRAVPSTVCTINIFPMC